MHFHESTIITTKEGLYCQVYSNEHPEGHILVKPKYIPTEKICSDFLPCRFISGQKMNRLNLWIDKNELKRYIEAFSRAYPNYIYKSELHDESPLFFAIPKENIERIYFPRTGLRDLMKIPKNDLDEHLKKVTEFVSFLLESGLDINDFGITYSTLMGHYSPNISDINIVVYGKNKFWKVVEFLEKAEHPDLRWKTYEEWEEFYRKRNRNMVHKKELYIKNMHRKKSEGYFKDTLFVIFAVENENETWFKWGEEKYRKIGVAKFKGEVIDNRDSVVRPGCYRLLNSEFVEGNSFLKDVSIKKIVFYSRDYCMLAYPGEKVEVKGIVEEVTPRHGEKYYRIVVGYLDAYINEDRNGEYIRIIKGEDNSRKISDLFNENTNTNHSCNLCREVFLEIGEKTPYGSIIIYKNGDFGNGWFATLSPVIGGNPEKDFTIQLMPFAHLTHFSQIDFYPKLAENYGVAFSKLSKVITEILAEENPNFETSVEAREDATSIATYGKCTNWGEKKEHLHIKLYPFSGNIGQPSPVDSSFGKKEIHSDEKGEFIKMTPVKKVAIEEKRLQELSKKLVEKLK